VSEDGGKILARLDHIAADVAEIKDTLKTINGRVRQNEVSIAVLSETALKFNVIKLSAILGAAIIIIGVVAWFVTGALP